jgi:hypothetical protein
MENKAGAEIGRYPFSRVLRSEPERDERLPDGFNIDY